MFFFLPFSQNQELPLPRHSHLHQQRIQVNVFDLSFNGVWIRDLTIPVRRSNQLSYEATDVGSWSFVSSNEPVRNGCEVVYEMFHILNCGFEIK